MSDDLKKPPRAPDPPDRDDPDAPPSAEEVAASQRLRDALAKVPNAKGYEEMELVDSLRAAWSPPALHEGVHAEMLDDLPMSDEEVLLAAELRDELESGRETSDVLVTALKAAWSPRELAEAEHDAILSRVGVRAPVKRNEGNVVELRQRKQTRTIRVVTVTATAVLALAASVFLFINMSKEQKSEAPMAMVKVRSTQPLFDEPFKAGEAGTASARIDKIAMARASDYRDNRFAKWGVR